jgi:hypothetical protein
MDAVNLPRMSVEGMSDPTNARTPQQRSKEADEMEARSVRY